MSTNRERMYGFVFHYNHMTKLWSSIPRDSYVDYWNGRCKNCLKNNSLTSLIKGIIR